MTDAHTPLDLALTYWPRRTGYRWWSLFDRSELREDMQRIASWGLRTVRICLMWEDLQPAPRKLNGDMLRLLERALDEVADAGLDTIISLFPVAIGGGLFLPRWLSSPDPLDDLLRIGAVGTIIDQTNQPAVISESRYRSSQARDLFRDAAAVEAQHYQISEVVGYFGSHPAVRFWQIGEGFERVHVPASDEAIMQWLESTVEAARAAYSHAPILSTTSTSALLNRAGPRPEQLVVASDMVAVAIDTPMPLPRFRLDDLDAVEFVYALASGLAERPLAVVGLGLPTAPGNRSTEVTDMLYGQTVNTTLVSGQRQSEWLAGAGARLKGLGAPLIVLADYADYPQALWQYPPLDRSLLYRTVGLVDASGRDKPAVDAVRTMLGIASHNATNPLRNDLDPERYWRNPADECLRLWRMFLRER